MAEKTTLMIDQEDRKLLAEVADANDWSTAEATRRAVHALFSLNAHVRAMAEHRGGETGRVLEMLIRDVDPALLLHPKPMTAIESEDGAEGIRIDNIVFFARDGQLLAQREVGGQDELYEVHDGRLVLVHPTPASVAALN
jgi:hypothetical protein